MANFITATQQMSHIYNPLQQRLHVPIVLYMYRNEPINSMRKYLFWVFVSVFGDPWLPQRQTLVEVALRDCQSLCSYCFLCCLLVSTSSGLDMSSITQLPNAFLQFQLLYKAQDSVRAPYLNDPTFVAIISIYWCNSSLVGQAEQYWSPWCHLLSFY